MGTDPPPTDRTDSGDSRDSHDARDLDIARSRSRASQQVAAAIAHELRNPVLGIVSAGQLLRYRASDDPLVDRNVGRILRDAERLNALISALLEYGRPVPVNPSPGDPDAVWTAVLDAHKGPLESKALLVTHRAAEPRAVCRIDDEQLAIAFAHVLANAVDATPEGGDLTIDSSVGDGTWRSQLRNQGAPIPREVLDRLFEPLVTTKAGHAGIGLAIGHRIVADHGGELTVESGSTPGTAVTVRLPEAQAV